MWAVYIRYQTARSVQSDLDLRCTQKLQLTSTVGKELRITTLSPEDGMMLSTSFF